MCSIVASFDINQVIELCKLNEHRGIYSHSITFIYDNEISYMKKELGPINYNDLFEKYNKDSIQYYVIVHQQAPTSDKVLSENIHPAYDGENCLWHNGIIKHNEIIQLQKIFNIKENWDTALLLKYLNCYGIPVNIDGSFACLYWDEYLKKLSAFRNDLAPLYIPIDENNKNCTLSSTKFKDSALLKSGVFFNVNFTTRNLVEDITKIFHTFNNPYHFEEKTVAKQEESAPPEDYSEWIRKHNKSILSIVDDTKETKITITELPNYQYSEPEIFEELQKYVDSTYKQHYSSGIQTTEFIMDHCENFDFLKGNIIKYVDRYGKKKGYNRSDLLKAFHYIMFMLHYDVEYKKSGKINNKG